MKELMNIPGLDPLDIVTIKKFKYGDKAKLKSLFSISIGQRNTTNVDVDLGEYQLKILELGIISAPFLKPGINIRDYLMNELDGDVGDFLFDAISEYNNLGDIKETEKKL